MLVIDSMSDAFKGAGEKSGLQLWRCEQEKPVEQTEFKFSPGYAYIALNTQADPEAQPRHEIHVWLGKECGSDQGAAAAMLAEQLGKSLSPEGPDVTITRNTGGQESEAFRALFPVGATSTGPGDDATEPAEDEAAASASSKSKKKRNKKKDKGGQAADDSPGAEQSRDIGAESGTEPAGEAAVDPENEIAASKLPGEPATQTTESATGATSGAAAGPVAETATGPHEKPSSAAKPAAQAGVMAAKAGAGQPGSAAEHEGASSKEEDGAQAQARVQQAAEALNSAAQAGPKPLGTSQSGGSLHKVSPSASSLRLPGAARAGSLTPHTQRGGTYEPTVADPSGSRGTADALKYEPGQDELDLEKLKEMKGVDGIDPTQKERYLADDAFQQVFGMDKEAFANMAVWRRNDLKKKVGLF